MDQLVESHHQLTYIDLSTLSLRRSAQQFISPPSNILSSFVCGSENASVSELFRPESIETLHLRSPVVLFGQNGTGKTVLAHELLQRWCKTKSNRTSTMTDGTEFARVLSRCIKADDMARFRQVYRECDALLIDNIHELITKPASQEELIAILNDFESQEKLFVATAPELPRLIGLNPSLQSRLSCGITTPVQPPGKDSRIAIVERLASDFPEKPSSEELLKFSERLDGAPTASQLKGLLLRWAHQKRIDPHSKPTPGKQFDRVANSRLANNRAAPRANCNDVLKYVAKELQLSLELLTGPSRKSGIVRARGLAMLLMRQLTDESFDAIGSHFSGRDHTTVMHACRKTEKELPEDAELIRIYDKIRQRFAS
jgi:chromosomal replication initiator protein